MTQQSINKITSEDLAKINSYLDQMEDELKNHYSEKEIIEIVQMTREQLFQQIEFQVAAYSSFDIDAIIEQNRKNNEALLKGNDRNQVVLTIPNPFSSLSYQGTSSTSKRSKRAKKKTSETISAGQKRSSEESIQPKSHPKSQPTRLQTSQYTPILVTELDEASILMIIALIIAVSSFIPAYFTQILSMIFIPIFLITSTLIVKNRKSLWLKSNLVVVISFFFFADSINYSFTDPDFSMPVLMFFMIPAFCIVFIYQILTTDIILDFSGSSNFVQIVSYFVVLFLFYSFVASVSIGIFLLQDGLETPVVTSIGIAILSYLIYRSLISPRLPIWDHMVEVSQHQQQSDDMDSSDETHDKTSDEVKTTKPKTKEKPKGPSDYKKVKFDKDNFKESSIFDASGDERVYLEIDRNAVNKYLGFRWITPLRILVISLAMGVFGLSFYVSRIRNKYELIYYQQLLGFASKGYEFWEFQEDLTYFLIDVGFVILGFLGLLLIGEFIKWLFRHSKKKVISHLILRQGSIPVSMLNQVPPKMKPYTYYNVLGDLIFDDLIVIRHQEGSQ